jgi:hypothetical protein
MSRKLTKLFAAASVLAGVAVTSVVLAAEGTPSLDPPQNRGTADDHGGMMHMMGTMGPDHMKQMTQMIENCSRMMEGMNHHQTAPSGDQTSTGNR